MSSLTNAFYKADQIASCSIGIDLSGSFYTANYGGDKLSNEQTLDQAPSTTPEFGL